MEQPVMLAISSCRVSEFKGIQMKSTPATHWYFNPDIEEVHQSLPEYRRRYLQQPPLNVTRNHPPDLPAAQQQNREQLSTLLQYNPETYKSVRFTATVTINSIHTYNTWYYRSCSQCTKKVKYQQNAYQCINHGKEPNPQFRYCFHAIVNDNSATATFAFFTPAATELTNIACKDLVALHPNPEQITVQISSTIGKTYNMQFHYDTKTTTRSYHHKQKPQTPKIHQHNKHPQHRQNLSYLTAKALQHQ